MTTKAERDAELKRDESEKVEATTVKTYPDGSQRFGCPPFPTESPAEEAARLKNEPAPGATPAFIPRGYKTDGEAAPVAASGLTAENFKAKIEQQVTSDVTAGKDPHTPNPTTSSDKPELAGAVPTEGEGLDPADPKDLEKLTKGVNPKVDATDEEIKAAAIQVARETKGTIVTDDKTSNKK